MNSLQKKEQDVIRKWIIWLVGLFLVLLILALIFVRRVHVEADAATRIEVRSGNTGETCVVTDEQDVQKIISYLNQLVILPKNNDTSGWRYGFSIEQSGKKSITYSINGNQLSGDGRYWILMGNHGEELNSIAKKYLGH